MDFPRWIFIRAALLSTIILCGLSPSQAQQAPVHTQGKEFWLGFMQNGFGSFSMNVQISSEVNTTGTVSIPLMGWSQPFIVTANSVTTVAVPAFAEHTGSEMITTKGVHVVAADVVNVYAVSSQSYTSDATSVLPMGSLGTQYIASAAEGLPGFTNFYRSELLVVATKDGTQIQITPSVPTHAGNPAGVPFTINLDEGETYQLHSSANNKDLTGTALKATAASGDCRPFAVFSGSMCANMPNTCTACDHLYEQNFPINTWGTKYFTAPFGGTTHYAYRVIAAQNGTTVTVDGAFLTTLNAGGFIDLNGQPQALCIDGSAPIAVFQFMQGYTCAGVGDPSMVMLNSVNRPMRKASFSTVSSAQINTHKISIVTQASNAGNVILNGTTLLSSTFTPFPNCATYVYRSITIPAGVNTIASTGGVLATAYGYGTGESYAFSLGSTKNTVAMSDTVICATGPITLIAPPQFQQVQWREQGSATVLATGQSYTFNATHTANYVATGNLYASGCPQQQVYQVEFNAPPSLTVTADDLFLCGPGQTQLHVAANPLPVNMTIQWSPAALLNNPNIADPIATVQSNTWFTVQVSSQAGCSYSIDSVQVRLPAAPVEVLSVSVLEDTLCQGQQTQLKARVTRTIALDGFSAGIAPWWGSVQGGASSNACGAVQGNALYFNGAGARIARTNAMDLTNGGQVKFALKIGAGVAPCDNADPGEDVILSYSTNGGGSWTNIATYNENAYPTFQVITVPVPLGAQTSNTMIRWRQPLHSGAGQDNWAIDDVRISAIRNTGLLFAWTPVGGLSNPSIPEPMVTPIASGWYKVRVQHPTFACVYTDSVFVNVGPQFTLTMTNDTNLCAPGNVPLSALPSAGVGHKWSWTPNNGSLNSTTVETPVANVATNTTYQVTVTSAHGCTATGQVQVKVDQILDMFISATDSSLCLGQNTQMVANVVGNPGAMTFSWSPAPSLSNAAIQAPVATPVNTTAYSVVVTDVPTGCTYMDTLQITTLNMSVNAGPDTVLCSATGYVMPLQHNAPSPTILWSPANQLNDATIAQPTVVFDSTSTYSVTVSDASGCSITEQVTITVPFSDLPITTDTSFCIGGAALLDAGYPGSTYQWSNGPQSQTISVNTSGSYTVTITEPNVGCQATLTTNVTVHNLPVVNLGPDTSLCAGDPLTLNAGNAGAAFLWSNNAISQSIQPTSTATVWVRITDVNTCVNYDSVQVVFNPNPIVPLNDTSACIGETIVLDAANAGSTFLWNNNFTTNSISVDSPGNYSVVVTSAAGCSAMGQSLVTFVAYPVVDLGPDTSICNGQSLPLNANNPGLNVLWSDNSTGQNISVNSAGVHWVRVSNGGCVSSDSLVLGMDALPTNNLSDIVGCEGDVILLDAGNPGSTYVWSITGDTTQTTLINMPGSYLVDITNPAGCHDQFEAQIDMLYYPIVELGNDTTVCEGEVITLNAGNPGISRIWNTGSTAQLIDVVSTGIYSVSVMNGNCVSSDTVMLTFRPRPHPITTEEILVCLDEKPHYVVIDAGNPGSQYQWSTGAITQKILAGAYGWYFVSISDNFDCSIADSVRVIENCPASLFIPNSFTPNGDGINDAFFAVAHNLAEFELLIFDRWGDLMFSTNDPDASWDGTLAGRPVPDGVYVWRLAYRHEAPRESTEVQPVQEQMGHVTIIR